MKKYILILLFLLIPITSFSGEWRDDGTAETPTGSDLINDIDTIIDGQIVQPLDRALAAHLQGATLVYNTGVTIDISAGSVVCSNSAGDTRKMRLNVSSVSATFAGNLDTGAEAGSTTYYMYANCDAAATTFTVKISASSTAPSGVTSYIKLGSFFNDSSSDIDQTKIYTTPNGFLRGDSSGKNLGKFLAIYDYGTSSSSSTRRDESSLFMAYGRATLSSGTVTVSNLPFSDTPSCVTIRLNSSDVSQAIQITSLNSSSVTFRDSQGTGNTVPWICVGE